jgi:hypothetical protein
MAFYGQVVPSVISASRSLTGEEGKRSGGAEPIESDRALGQLFQDEQAKASELDEFGASQGGVGAQN